MATLLRKALSVLDKLEIIKLVEIENKRKHMSQTFSVQ